MSATLSALLAQANPSDPAGPAQRLWTWPPESVHGAMINSAAFAILGIVLLIFGFKLFDWLTPGNLQKEVFENKNTAAAILGGAVILGVCWIIASSMH